MSKTVVVIMIAALMVTAVALSATGQCPLTAKKAVASGAVVNTACPVMDSKVSQDTPYKLTYKGKTIGFCCSGCGDAFKADPEKYEAKLNEDIRQQIES